MNPVVAKAASLVLRYPDAEVLAAMPLVHEAVAALSSPLASVAAHRIRTPATALAVEYVDLFDLRRRCCLYLTYYTDGDTRNRGQALLRFAHAFQGFTLDGELPDYLPAVLELAAHAGEPGWALLRDYRVGLDLLAQALAEHGSVYRHAVEAVRAMLPAPKPTDLATAAALARSGPPTEQVGVYR